MRIDTLPALQITCCILLLILAPYVLATPKIKPSNTDDNDNGEKYLNEEIPKNHRKQLEDEIDLDDVFDAEQLKGEQIPFLPPIILLDFVNGTADTSSNATSEGDEKSKRTIDGSLGYGFDQNNFFSGKHNFYFPGGKGATSVSIEESISPFEPKTLTEIEKPITENSDADAAQEEQKSRKALFEQMPEPLPLQNNREPLPIYPPFAMFGQRTKLYKTPTSEFGQQSQRQHMKFSSSYSTIPGSDTFNKLLSTYTSVRPTSSHVNPTSFPNSANLHKNVRPMSPSYVANYMSDIYSSGSAHKSSYDLKPSLGETPTSHQEINLASFPRYTIENGIKYEHKIVWKYPDGRVSETPPMSYMNSYSEHVNPASTGGFRPSIPYQPRPTNSQQQVPAGPTSYNQYTTAAQNNIHSQKPIQFPNDQEQPNHSHQQDSTRFVSPSAMNISPVRQSDVVSSYNLPSYQGQYGLRQRPKISSYKPTSNQNDQFSAYSNNYRPISMYNINTPDTEYSFQDGNQFSGNLFMSDGQLNKQVLSKYTPQAQEYLTKVFANSKTAIKHGYRNEELESYANTDYSNLLNYNPSISQYIKNPSSILKAQPTFVQAGDSLIPVIILRVDGAPPVPSKSNSNINLKSLLRQYLTQYANNVSKATQSTNYNLGSSIVRSEAPVSQSNPVEDLKELTETLASLRQRGYRDPDFANNPSPAYAQQPQPALQQNSGIGQEYGGTNYKGYFQNTYSNQQVKKPMKVKNVQIIEDPRYTSYKVDN